MYDNCYILTQKCRKEFKLTTYSFLDNSSSYFISIPLLYIPSSPLCHLPTFFVVYIHSKTLKAHIKDTHKTHPQARA